MKKFGLLLLTLVFVMQFGVCYALGIQYDIIPKVEVSGLKTPYNYTGVLDTDVELTKESRSVVHKVEWDRLSSGTYVVTITVRPGVYVKYDANTIATVNGKPADFVRINDKNYLEIVYTYPDTTPPTEVNDSVMTHVITVYYTKNGQISPNPIRAPHGKHFTVQIIPDEGYEVEDVEVDGESVGAVTEYTFKKVKETHKIRASFKPIEGYEKVEEPIEFDREAVDWAVELVRSMLQSFASLKR